MGVLAQLISSTGAALVFGRKSNGSVRILNFVDGTSPTDVNAAYKATPDTMDDPGTQRVNLDVTLTAREWATQVALVSARADDGDAFVSAAQLHGAPI
jgi:hypothetical protein